MKAALSIRSAALVALLFWTPAAARADDLTAAHEMLEEWQVEDAFAVAQRLLAQQPRDPAVLLLAARVQHHRGEHLSALELLTAAEEAGADVGGLKSLVETSARYAAQFATLDAEHFKIRYLNKDEIVAYYAAPVLESSYRNVGSDLRAPPAERGEKIPVEIYPDAHALAGATGLTIKEIETSGTIAVCRFHRIMIISPLATAAGYEWADTLSHELVHLIVSKKTKNTIPIWLHEGVAKYYESRWKGKAGEALSPFSEKLLAEAMKKRRFVTFEQMHPSMAKLSSQEEAALAFAEVFTLIEYLNSRFGTDSVPRVLELAAGGTDLEQALKQVYGSGLKGLESAWHRHLEKRKFRRVAGATAKPIKLAASEAEAQAEQPLEKIEEREVHDLSRLGELLQLRGHHAAAVVEYEKAYKKAGLRYSTLINRLVRAYLAVERGNDAIALLGRLLEAHPSDGDAHLMLGRIQYARRDYAAARRHIEAVQLTNPFNPEPHELLAAISQASGDTAGAERERHFLELARKPRPTRTYELPAPPAGTAHLHIVAPLWRPVRIDGGEPRATPAWDLSVAPGVHNIEFTRKDGSAGLESVTASEGEARLVLLE